MAMKALIGGMLALAILVVPPVLAVLIS